MEPVSTIQILETPDFSVVRPELRSILPHLPKWRLDKVLSYRFDTDRFLCAKSFLMLEDMLRKQFGLNSCPEFAYGSNGKPFLRDYPDIFFNISHCRKGIACAVSGSPVGIDIEEIQYDEGLAASVLNPEEMAAVRSSDEPDVKFTEFWTRKESCLKLSGEGLRNNMKDILSKAEGVCLRTEVRRSAGFVCSTALAIHS